MDLLHRQRHERHAHEHRQRDDRPGPGEADRAVRPSQSMMPRGVSIGRMPATIMGRSPDHDRGEGPGEPGGSPGQVEGGSRGEHGFPRSEASRATIMGGPRPPWLHGLQRRRRHAVFAEPLTARACGSPSAAYSEHVGWYLQVGASATPGEGASVRSTMLTTLTPPPSQELVHVLAEPGGALGVGGLDEAGPHDEHVVATRRDVFEPGPPELAEPALDAVALHGRAGALRHGEAEAGLVVRLLARKPVEDEVAGRRRAALAVDGVEVLRAGEPVPTVHPRQPRCCRAGLRRRVACGPVRGGA